MSDHKHKLALGGTSNSPYKPPQSLDSANESVKQLYGIQGSAFDSLHESISISRRTKRLPRGLKHISEYHKLNQININDFLKYESYRDLPEFLSSQAKRNAPKPRSASTNRKNFDGPTLNGLAFINVRYKFTVDYRHLYSMHKLDPNLPVEIENVVSVIAPRGNACPVCLSETPVAPRMIMSCGHIICLKCVLCLLSTNIPKAQKRQAESVVEKYRTCPLCSCIIRLKELKPVQLDMTDERFETPRPQYETVFTLMLRPKTSFLALPCQINEQYSIPNDFPNINHPAEMVRYLRILRADYEYVVRLYSAEKNAILQLHDHDRVLYNESREFVDMAIQHIDSEMESWRGKLCKVPESHDMSLGDCKINRINSSNYYFYQTNFHTSTQYVLAPLDMKVLLASYQNQYHLLPSLVVAKVENIRFEVLTTDTATSKYKFLSHFPVGTTIGFLECDWRGHAVIAPGTWKNFHVDLSRRSKISHQKFSREERARLKALHERDMRTKDFYARENGYPIIKEGLSNISLEKLQITPDTLPIMAAPARNAVKPADTQHTMKSQLTVWGTVIPNPEAGNINDPFDENVEEMLRKATEEFEKESGKGRRRKKRIVLLSSF